MFVDIVVPYFQKTNRRYRSTMKFTTAIACAVLATVNGEVTQTTTINLNVRLFMYIVDICTKFEIKALFCFVFGASLPFLQSKQSYHLSLSNLLPQKLVEDVDKLVGSTVPNAIGKMIVTKPVVSLSAFGFMLIFGLRFLC